MLYFFYTSLKTINILRAFLNWAYEYAESNISTLNFKCGDGSLNARNRLSTVTFSYPASMTDSQSLDGLAFYFMKQGIQENGMTVTTGASLERVATQPGVIEEQINIMSFGFGGLEGIVSLQQRLSRTMH